MLGVVESLAGRTPHNLVSKKPRTVSVMVPRLLMSSGYWFQHPSCDFLTMAESLLFVWTPLNMGIVLSLPKHLKLNPNFLA